MITFPVEVTKNELFDVLYIAALSQCCMDEKKVVPVPSSFRKAHECVWCDFSDYCWPYDESPIKAFGKKEHQYVKHLAINTAEELYEQREGRYVETLEGLLSYATRDETKPYYKLLLDAYEKTPRAE